MEDAFYSRKAYLFPEKQLSPHTSWKDECARLDTFFQGSGYQVSRSIAYLPDSDSNHGVPVCRYA